MDKETAKEKVKKLVQDFDNYSKDEINKKSETQIQSEFIDPLFEALGWDMRKDAQREQRVLKGRADYIFNLGNQEAMVVEAKKTDIHLREEQGRQAVSYAYHRKIKFAVLTNFRYVRVYHALSNIKHIDKNLLKDDQGYLWIEYKDFIEQFDRLWLLSKESFENEEINKLLSKKDERQSKSIDQSILIDLLQFREWLSKDLKKKRTYLRDEAIDEIVQILIDRLIFMRAVEDRGLEDKDFLLKLIDKVERGDTDKNLWALLKIQFKIFNKLYNSKLFAEGLLEKEGFFDKEVLEKVIKGLYYGTRDKQERYMFDEIPGDLLGNIYEQYLGTILKGTEKRVKLDLESGKRKRMGIYYTPSYIVDYIVKNTVGEYVKDKSIDEILNMKVVDPACGSGSFLIKAFQEICDTIESRLKKGEKSSKWETFKDVGDKLNLNQKSTILRNCIYGVDLDEKATELAQLNLLLKLLEEESKETRDKLLPLMKHNIKCGNSLVDDPKIAGDEAFNWKAQFAEVFNPGGFDIVIGNPPYIRIQSLEEKDVEFYNQKYRSPKANYDIYLLFVEKGYHLLNKRGSLGYILPNKFFTADYGENLRNFLLEEKALHKIVDFKDFQVFENATTYTNLLFLSKKDKNNFTYCFPSDHEKLKTEGLNEKNLNCSGQDFPRQGETWNFSDKESTELMEKLNRFGLNLSNIASSIFQGMVTGADRFYFVKIIDEEENFLKIKNNIKNKVYKIEKDVIKKLLKGKEIKRYFVDWNGFSVIYPYDLSAKKGKLMDLSFIKNNYPLFFKYLKDYEKDLKEREKGKFKEDKNWHRFGRTQNIDKFENKKILTQVLSNSNKFTLDKEGEYYFVGGGNAGGYGIILNDGYRDKYEIVLGLLNSKVLEFYLKNISTKFRGGYYSYAKRFIENLPIKLPESKEQEEKIKELVNRMLELKEKYHNEDLVGREKERIEDQIKQTDYEIDQEVYKLYGLTDEEIKIVENSLK